MQTLREIAYALHIILLLLLLLLLLQWLLTKANGKGTFNVNIRGRILFTRIIFYGFASHEKKNDTGY